jgi:hypothetical protein
MNPIIWLKFAWDFVAKVILKLFFKEKPHDQCPAINAGHNISAGGDVIVGNKSVINNIHKGDRIAGDKVTNLNVSLAPSGISEQDIKEAKEDLLNFLRKLHDSKYPTIPDTLIQGNLIESYRKEIGTVRFSKLEASLTAMKVCRFFKVVVGPPVPSIDDANYSKDDIEHLIADVEKGQYNRYLR